MGKIENEKVRESCRILKKEIAISHYLEKEGRVSHELWEGTGMIRCPFPDHQDSTPSFSYDDNKGLFNCFGCGRGGDIVSLHHYFKKIDGDRVSMIKAIRYLARTYEVRIPDLYAKSELKTGRVNKYRRKEVSLDNLPDEFYREKIKGYKEKIKKIQDIDKKAKIYMWLDDEYLGLRDIRDVFRKIRGELT